MHTVFISYSWKDKAVAARVKTALEAQGIRVTIDSESVDAGGDIREFIDRSVRQTQVTLQIVSKNSLISDWVALETFESFAAEKYLGGKEFIPCCIDRHFFKTDFIIKVADKIDREIARLEKQIRLGSARRLNLVNLEAQKSRR